jgi:hypothetical protein
VYSLCAVDWQELGAKLAARLCEGKVLGRIVDLGRSSFARRTPSASD